MLEGVNLDSMTRQSISHIELDREILCEMEKR